MSKRPVHYVLSTHWDREWYQSFQNFRYQLVRLLDQVFDGLEDDQLQGPFQTDGQSIILEDYLEVRPEARPRIEALAQAGKLVIGPWYVMPDEFLVSGEALIRNLRLGRDLARSFGVEPSDAGFLCDLFGHNSQMPQILAGFGIRGGFIWRGTNFVEQANFIWRGADGTEMTCYRFGRIGYCTYAIAVRQANQREQAFDAEQFWRLFDEHLAGEATRSPIAPILIFDGCDHLEWDPLAYETLLTRFDQDDARFTFQHSSLDAYLEDMLAQSDNIDLIVTGELREPGLHPGQTESQWLIPGVLSSRVWLKQRNTVCQTLLCHWAEPLNAFACLLLEREYPRGFLNVAWKWLLRNHPHDSICGCSIDTVHDDMQFRFSQAEQIADRLTHEAALRLAASIEGDLDAEALRVVVFNPLPRPVNQTLELALDIPTNWPTFNEFFGFEPKPGFRIYNHEGAEVPYQRVQQRMNQTRFEPQGQKLVERYEAHTVTVSLPLDVPPLGYTTLTLRPDSGYTRYPNRPGLLSSERSLENEYLAVTIERNGSLTLHDKRNDQTYQHLLTFEDCVDIGDGWFHGPAVNDAVYTSTAARSAIACLDDGPMLGRVRIRTEMQVPRHFQFDSMTRAEEFSTLVIDTILSLRPGQTYLEFETTVHNTLRDHRLRVLFPTGAKTETYLADSPFDVIERPIALRSDNHLHRELEVETKPQQSWSAVFDRLRGLAVVADGLLETAAIQRPEHPLALTLFRGTQRTVFTNGEPGGQGQGLLKFRYRLVPLNGRPDVVKLTYQGQQLSSGIRHVHLRPQDVTRYRHPHVLPPLLSFLSLEGAAVLTSTRQIGEGLELRLYNPLAEVASITLRVLLRFKQYQLVNFESQPLGDMTPFSDGVLSLELQPKQILTLHLT